MSMNLYDLFRQTARRQPGHPAVLGPGEGDALTYRGLDEAIRTAADNLQKAGLHRGDCVGLHCPSSADYILLTYAVWRSGGCVVPIPPELTATEKQEICREISLNFVLSEKRTAAFAAPFQKAGGSEVWPGRIALPVTPACEHPAGFHDINSAFIRFTSGTTGTSKGVVLSHECIHDRIQAANDVLHIGPDDRIVWLLSMSYHFAVSIVSYLSFGAAVVLLPNHFAQAIVGAASRHRATLIYGSPAHYTWLAGYAPGAEEGVRHLLPERPEGAEEGVRHLLPERPEGAEKGVRHLLPERPEGCFAQKVPDPFFGTAPLPSLRLAIATTAGVGQETAAAFHRRFGLPVTQALGIIEVGLPFINVDFAADRSEAIGRVLPAYQLLLEDVGLGPNLKEILLSGKGFLDAYYRPWRTRAQIMPGGWFRTGDVAMVDADGCVFLRGRTKDVINVMGMKFFPQEVEAVLNSHPRVKDSCVVPQPDARLGEVAIARIIAVDPESPPAESELLEYCQKQLASYKVPQRIDCVDTLWRTASGKVIHRHGNRPAAADRDPHELTT
jgi:long-chain acyl-CoA synthetase